MSRSAGNSWRAKAGVLAALLPFLALTACAGNSQDQAMSEKLAAAEAAANKAIEAQHAAEKAAATAASIRPAPAPEQPMVAEPFNDDDDDGHGNGNGNDNAGNEEASAGEMVVPGQG